MTLIPRGDWISLREAAAVIGCSKRNVLYYVAAKRLKVVDVDGFRMVRRADAERFVKPKRGRPKQK